MKYKKWLVINPRTLRVLKECDSLKNARMAMASATGRFNRDICAIVEADVSYNPRKPLFLIYYYIAEKTQSSLVTVMNRRNIFKEHIKNILNE